jgi:hypothetical protein
MFLTAYEQNPIATVFADGGTQPAGPVDPHQHSQPQIQASRRDPTQQLIADLLILGGPLVIAQDRFRPHFIDAQSNYEGSLRNSTPSNMSAHSRNFDRSRLRRSSTR